MQPQLNSGFHEHADNRIAAFENELIENTLSVLLHDSRYQGIYEGTVRIPDT